MPSVGARSPESLELTITSSDDFDMTTVDALDLYVRLPNDNDLVWEWAIQSATTSSLVLAYVFAPDGSDAPMVGSYKVWGWLLSSGSKRRVNPMYITFTAYP